MKIKIKSEKKGFTLHLPMRLMAWIIKHGAEQSQSEESFKDIDLYKELKAAKKTFGRLKIVEIKSADGDVVEITL